MTVNISTTVWYSRISATSFPTNHGSPSISILLTSQKSELLYAVKIATNAVFDMIEW